MAVVLAVVLLAVVLVGSFLVVWLWQDLTQAVIAVVIGFAINSAAALFAVMVGISKLEELFLRAGRASEFGPLADFWAVPNPTKPWLVIFGGRPPDSPKDPELRISYSTVFAFAQISSVIR